MKAFDKSLEEEMERHISDLDSQGCSDREQLRYLSWFREGALYAETNPELINEILTKYMAWVDNTPKNKFSDWLCEEGDDEKMEARIRKEFIEYLKPNNQWPQE